MRVSRARASRRFWCRRSSVATRIASTAPAASAATSSAVRPTLKTASSNGTWSGSERRALDGRGLAVRDPHHDGELARERDAYDPAPGDRDHTAVERGRRVVGVAFELGRDAQSLGPGLAGGVALLRVHREQPGDPRRGREARDRGRRESAIARTAGRCPPAFRNARTAGCVSGAGSSPSANTSR